MLNALLRNTSIKSRLIVSFLVLSILPLTITAHFAYTKSSKAINSKIGTYSVEIMDQLKNNIRSENKKFEYLSDQIMMDKLVQTGLTNFAAIDDSAKRENTLNINQMLGEKFDLLKPIKALQINTVSGDVFYDIGYDYLLEEDIERIKRMIAEKKGEDVWTFASTKGGFRTVVLGREIHSRHDFTDHLGYLFIAVDEAFYSDSVYMDVNMGVGTDLFIMDASGNVLSSRNPQIATGEPFADGGMIRQIALHEKDGIRAFPYSWNDQAYLAAYAYDIYAKWYLTSIIPQSYLNEETGALRNEIMIICGICFIIAVIATLIISSSISTPMNKLILAMEQVKKGDLSTDIRDGNRDEIGYLFNRFNKMVKQIESLIAKMETEQKLKRATELQMLQAQINPHFLFNTLNSLKWTAAISQADSVRDGLGALAELLRSTIVDKKEMIRLRDELKNVEHYILIQKIRYGTSFHVRYEIDDRLLDCKMIKFLLQPIVENAILHGQQGIGHEETVTIRCEETGGRLQITIRDDGIGMEEAKAERLLAGKVSSEHRLANIGITNVQERIKLHFGADYGLQIRSRPGEGTAVIITMPLIAGEEGDSHA
ncbi:cache domain-containing sensor histidine kinase [Paenibacillus contaminans]|uniref:histidine kinase n=1 Tax=Paenibacillus contaminans TaxID=450362 RepID=A0A329MMQ0_9BACL|nr:sensor histidine kinase [Paenibacillus contaminans]RAV21044.1 hypothetical protein DQG23_13250 [Paenibacillus contaminans]